MAHERQDIRNAIVAQLSGKTDAGTRIFKSRMVPLRSAELPALSVYMMSETIDAGSVNTAPRELKRTLTVAIVAWVNAADKLMEKLDDTFDAIALQIETAMDADLCLGDTAFISSLSAIDTVIDMEGDRPMGCIRLEYSVVYHTDLRTQVADAAREEFNTLDVKTAVVRGMASADQTEDLITNIHE